MTINDLKADSRRDLGAIWMTTGGMAIVELPGEVGFDIQVQVVDRDGSHLCHLPVTARLLRTETIPSGDYCLLISGRAIAAMMIPFSIEAGRESKIQVATSQGERHRIEFTLNDDIDAGAIVTLEAWQESRLVFRGFTEVHRTKRAELELMLSPGVFKFVATTGDSTGTTVATVGGNGPLPTQIDLR